METSISDHERVDEEDEYPDDESRWEANSNLGLAYLEHATLMTVTDVHFI